MREPYPSITPARGLLLMLPIGPIADLAAVLVASLSIMPLLDVSRLARSPAVKRGWQALTAAAVICIVLLAVASVTKSCEALDVSAAAELGIHLVSAVFVVAIARLSRRTAQDVLRLAVFERQAFSDGLTGLGNRRLFTERLEEETARAREAGTPLSLIVLDIDHFKRVNDTYGHAVGDIVLKHVADKIAAAMRNADIVCRVGGEEFVAIMPRINPAAAVETAGALRACVSASTVPIGDGRTVVATVSLGLATRQPGETAEALFRRADAALYAAKRGGRDRVALAA